MPIQIKEYRTTKKFERDANKMESNGWTIKDSMEKSQRTGIGRFMTLGFFALIFKPKPHIVVTYTKGW